MKSHSNWRGSELLYAIGVDENCNKYLECGFCHCRSYNPNDIEHKYCGHCHAFLKEMRK